MSDRSLVRSGTTQRFMAVRSARLGFVFASLCCHIAHESNRDFREGVNRQKNVSRENLASLFITVRC